MDDLLESLASDPLGRLVIHHVAAHGLWNCFVFLLVAARLSGILLLAPLALPKAPTVFVRLLLVVMLSLVIAPTLAAEFDGNKALQQVSETNAPRLILPTTLPDLVCLIAMETGIGALLGVGLIAVFSGLRLAGELIDRHSGLGIVSAEDGEWLSADSAGSSVAMILGLAAILLLEPTGGHYVILRTLVHSFHTVPVGTASDLAGAVQLLSGLVQESLLLGIRISLPLIAMMLLIDVAIAFAGRGTSQAFGSVCLVVRTGIGIGVLAITMTNVPEVIATTLVSVQQTIGASFGF
jgi:flagellar biosynthetic protein FliR